MGKYVTGDLDELAATALEVLESGVSAPGMPLIDGRVLSVQASPDLENADDMAWGIAALPAGYSVPEHSHRAEEFAMILRGGGTISIEDEDVAVASGKVLVTPPHARHRTTAGPDGPLVVYWVYGPAGSEGRWLESR